MSDKKEKIIIYTPNKIITFYGKKYKTPVTINVKNETEKNMILNSIITMRLDYKVVDIKEKSIYPSNEPEMVKTAIPQIKPAVKAKLAEYEHVKQENVKLKQEVEKITKQFKEENVKLKQDVEKLTKQVKELEDKLEKAKATDKVEGKTKKSHKNTKGEKEKTEEVKDTVLLEEKETEK